MSCLRLQDQINIFKRKICTRLLHSKSNKSRRASYKQPITVCLVSWLLFSFISFIFSANTSQRFPIFFQKVQYLAKNPKAQSDNGDVYIVDSQTGGKKHKIGAKNTSGTKKISGQSSQAPRARGRPRKDAQKMTASTNQNSIDSINTVAPTVHHESRRVSLPSQFYMSPYRQP
jgi:hypothetical protein